MEFGNHQVLFVISIGFLISSISVKCSNLSQFSSIADEVTEAFGPVFNEAEERIGPVSSFDLDKAEEALGPIPSLDEAKQAFGPISSEALSPVIDGAKQKLGPISPSTLEKAKSVSTKALDKVEKGFDSITSWISQNKLDVSSYLENAQKEVGPVSSSIDLDKVKEALAPISPSAEEALPPISPSIVDEAKHAIGPISPETLNEAKEKFGSITSWFSQTKEELSSNLIEEAEKELSLISSTGLDKDRDRDGSNPGDEAKGSFSHKALDEAKEKFGSLSSLISQNKEEEEISSSVENDEDASGPAPSPVSPSTLNEAKHAIGSISSKALDEAKETFGSITSFFSQNKVEISSQADPVSDAWSSTPPSVTPSTLEEAEDAIDSFSNKALDEAKDKFGSISSFFSQNKEELSSSSSMIYIDHDVALAIESLIKQGQSNSHLAMEEAKKQLSVTETIASPDRGTCIKKCIDNYSSCLDSFNKALEELRARHVELLTDDVNSVEEDIYACQKCFLDKEEKQSSLKDLEEAIIKATRECLNVLHHSG